jgi:4-hydroxybenzoate polyprenyltransferase
LHPAGVPRVPRGIALRAIYNLVRLARPSHWLKNLFVFAAILFAREKTPEGVRVLALQPEAWLEVVKAFIAFCLASSAIYTLNDVLDRKEDARHPEKRRRPVASGETGVGTALVMAAVLAAGAIAVSAGLAMPFPLTVALYLAVMLAYVLGLKRVAVLDVLILAVGFVIRAYAGAVAIDVWVSPWLILCTLTLALFLGFAKRESERVALGPAAAETRLIEWSLYDEKSLEHMMTVSAALALVTYMLYTVSPESIARVGHPWMFLTVLPVVYGVFRFYRMAIAGRAADPVDLVRRDPAFVVAVAVWVGMAAALLLAWPKAPPGHGG